MSPTTGRAAEPSEGVTGGDVARSVRWTYGMAGASLLAQLALASVLARILTPADYGTVAVAAGILRFLQYLTDLGLGSVVIQKPDFRADTDAPLLFAFGFALHAAFVGALWLAAPLLLAALPQLAGDGLGVLRALAVVGVVTAAGQTARAMLARRLDFRTAGLITVAGLLVGQGAVAVPLAAAGFGAWSLVAGLAAQAAVGSVLAWRAAPHALLPRRAALSRWRSLAALGGGFSVLRALDSAGIHLLPAGVGVLAGVAAVGQWDRAWVLAVLPIELLASGLGRVLFPAFSRLAADPGRLRRAWLEALLLSSCLLGPIAAGLAVAAPEIVQVVLGAGWDGTSETVLPLALWAALRGLAQVTGSLCEASGRLLLRGLHQAGYLAFLVVALAFVRPEDGAGVAFVLLAVDGVAQLVLIALAAGTVGLSPAEPIARLAVGLSVAPPIAAAGTGALAVMRMAGAGNAASLACAIAACAAALAATVAIHPSRTLRSEVAHRILGQALGIPAAGPGPLSRLRRLVER